MFDSVLIANRGEIAIRIARALADLGLRSVAVHAQDDAASLHVARADEARALPGRGVAGYLDAPAMIAAAQAAGCGAIHPGYGFLSENAGFARACGEAGLVFIGPSPESLALFGDKAAARDFAVRHGAPIVPGGGVLGSAREAEAFFDTLAGAPMLIKAAHGGGGRGIRLVRERGEIAEHFARAAAEAQKAFGDGALFAERLIFPARHIEVQIAGDSLGEIVHFRERECSTQRRRQKIVEIAPAMRLHRDLAERIRQCALSLARAAGYRNLGTFEFLVEGGEGADDPFFFIEANPRLQVEHTVTEEALGIDLVQTQIEIAQGRSLSELGFSQSPPPPRRTAVQLRINAERIGADGAVLPAGGALSVFEPAAGPGLRVDSCAFAGFTVSGAYDSLIAKLIVSAPTFEAARTKAIRALDETRIEGVETNAAFLRAVLNHPQFAFLAPTTTFVDENVADLAAQAAQGGRRLFVEGAPAPAARPQGAAQAGARAAPEGQVAIAAPLLGTIVAMEVGPGEKVAAGRTLAVLEAMKMEHLVVAPQAGFLRAAFGETGQTVAEGETLFFFEPAEADEDRAAETQAVDLDAVRPDLAELFAREALLRDESRPGAVARRRKTGQRTARENIAQLCEGGAFHELGAFAVAARRATTDVATLARDTPGDGVVCGVATVNAPLFGPDKARAMVVAYDYTVMAGTQGQMNHKKQDRMFELAGRWGLPVVLYAEGGGGRPGDTDRLGLTGLDGPTFARFAGLSGLVPLVGVVSGRCFAGNAALLGCCDVIIATRDANIGMGGPAMIEGGGLGVHAPEEVGPVSVQAPNGVIDILVADEVEATAAAKKYLSYFQGPVGEWTCADQRLLRRAIPENRLRVYDVRALIDILCDTDGVLELRRDFGRGMITALARIEGRPVGLIANDSRWLGGAIDAEAADKAARFLQLCQAHGLPIVSLCDTPGFMVGPEAEKTALVRRVCRMFVAGARITVPCLALVLRKGYGLGAMAMAAGGFHAPFSTAAWPTGEFGGMGLEGAVRLGFKKELEAIADPAAREKRFRELVDVYYENGKALNIASVMEIDGVIDPADSRRWILAGLSACGEPRREDGAARALDTW